VAPTYFAIYTIFIYSQNLLEVSQLRSCIVDTFQNAYNTVVYIKRAE
jgi:hypothetical protein